MHSFLLIPFDGANLKAKGASEAPKALSSFFNNSNKINVKVDNFNHEDTQKNIENTALKEYKKNNLVVGLGGDHSVTYGLVCAAAKKYPNLTLIYFDAHLDAEDDFIPPSHEDVIKSLVKQQVIDPKNILIIGARKYWPKETRFILNNQIKVLYASQNKQEIQIKIKEFLKDRKNIYVSVDIDFFDKSIAFATGYPEKKGYFLKDFKEFTTSPEFKRMVGFDLVEVSPSIDKDNITTTLASNVIKHLLMKRDEYTETYI